MTLFTILPKAISRWSTMKFLSVAMFLFMGAELLAQPWTYDFGTSTGSYNTASGINTAFFPSTPSGGGTYRIRCATTGNQGTGFILANPGTSLGTDSEVQINASITTSANKFTVYGWDSPATVASLKFSARSTSTGNGYFDLHLGSGAATTFQDNTGTAFNQSLAVVRLTYTSGALTVQRRISGSFSNITSSGIAKDTDNTIEIFGNNASTSTTYIKSGSNSLNAQSWDLWVDGTKISPSGGWPTAGTLAANTTLAGIGFFGEQSTGNVAFLYLDDLEYSNALPTTPPCTAPSTQASDISFSSVGTNGMSVNWTNGNGAGRVVLMNSTNSFTAPTNGSDPTANTVWANSGQQVIFNGTGSGPVSITGLTPSTIYHFRVYEYCSPDRNYQGATATGNPASQATSAGTSLSATTLSAFGAQCLGNSYGPNSFTITGTLLNTDDVVVAALAGYQYSTSEFGTYTNSLSISQPGGSFSQQIWVRFNPIAAVSYNGNIVVSGGGASSINVAASGSGVLGTPVITTPTSASITSTTAVLGGNITSIGCSFATTRGIFWSTTNGFADGAGTQVSATGTFDVGTFTVNVSSLPPNTTIYYKAFATNDQGTVYTSQASFTTSQFFIGVGDVSIVGWNCNTTDDFAFVTWVDLPNNTIIKFTDGGFNGTAPNSANTTGNARSTESFVIWRNNTGNTIDAGTVIKITGLTATIGLATGGTATVGLDGALASGGDQIFAYQGNATSGTNPDYAASNNAATTFSGNILYGLHFQGSGGQASWRTTGSTTSNDSYLPTELNVANGNIAFGSNISHGQYTGTRTGQATIAGYKALVNSTSNWTTGTGASGTVSINTTPFVVSSAAPTKIVVTSVNGGVIPTVGQPFFINIETRDNDEVVQSVLANTNVSVSVFTGGGTLSGTITGTLTAGTGTLTLSGIIYSLAQSGVVLRVSRTSGDVLTAGDAPAFTVGTAATKVNIVNLQPFGYTNNALNTFTVEARRADETIDAYYPDSISVALFSGTGNLLGTLKRPAVNGIATFPGLTFDQPGFKVIQAFSGALTPAFSNPLEVSTPVITELVMPRFVQGNSGTNSNRVPMAYRVRISGLEPNRTFKFYNLLVDGTDAANSNGAGVVILNQGTGNFTRSTSPSFNTAGNHAEFTTDALGTYSGWFFNETSGNDRFAAGNQVQARIILNNGNGGTTTAVRITAPSTITVLSLGTGATQATALRGNSNAAARNIVALYDNTSGTGRPLSCTYVESDGTANTLANSYSNFYATQVDGVAGAYGTIIPNNLPNGVRRIEQRSLSTGFMVSCPGLDSDGIWPGGANTVNPNTGTTAKVITISDAPFTPNCVYLLTGNNDTFLQASLTPNSGSSFPASNCFNHTLVGATVSLEGSALNVLPGGGQDRWYAIIAQSSAFRVLTTTSAFDMVLELHAADGALLQTTNDVAGIGGETMTATGLTPGLYYFVAVRSYNGALGAYSACMQNLQASFATGTAAPFDLCSNLKPQWTGANSYTFTFVATGATPASTTSITVSGQVPLATASLGLRYGGTYNVTVDANYTSISPQVTVPGIQIIPITIAAHPVLETKATQQCPATVLRGTILNAKPFICSATNFTVSFQRISACTGGSYIDPMPFEVTTTGASSNLQLNFVTPQALVPQSWYEVRWRPNFAYGPGTYGNASVIFVGGSVLENELQNTEPFALTERSFGVEVEAAIYPNPNNGSLVNLNLINAENDWVSVRIMDATGRLLFSKGYVVSGSLNTNVQFAEPLSSGMYFVEFTSGNRVVTEKMLVNN